MTGDTRPPSPCPLLALPPELRNRIWTTTFSHTLLVLAKKKPHIFALLWTCREIRAEATGICFANLTILASDHYAVIDFLRRLDPPLYQAIGHLRYDAVREAIRNEEIFRSNGGRAEALLLAMLKAKLGWLGIELRPGAILASVQTRNQWKFWSEDPCGDFRVVKDGGWERAASSLTMTGRMEMVLKNPIREQVVECRDPLFVVRRAAGDDHLEALDLPEGAMEI